MDVVYKELDKQCVTLVEWLLEHGRLTLGQLCDKNDNRKFPSESDLRNTLIRLLNARYVERCPAGEPYIALLTDDEAAAAKKPKRAKTSKLIEDLETTEQRALAAAVPMESLRFSLVANTGIDIGEKRGEDSPDIYAGGKRKHEALESDKEPEVTQSEKEILWRPNFEEFVRFLRHEACIANVRSRLDNGAVIVLRAILKATRRSELKVKTVNSVPMSLNNIFEEVMKSVDGRTMTLEHVRASLVQLGCNSGGKGTDDLYSVDLKKLIDLSQNDEVESIVLKKYGMDAYRIFRLLTKSSCLIESDKISDTTFVEKKDTAMILHKLWKDNYVCMEKVTVQGARQSQKMLWKINRIPLWEHVIDDMYHTALNLSIRQRHEVGDEREILWLKTAVGPVKKKQEQIRKVCSILHSCLMRLDDAMMLFRDF